MPSRAGTPRKEHEEYYGLIRSINDPIWDSILPPNGWGCLCNVTNTDEEETPGEVPALLSPAGIAGNAAKEKAIFTNSHPMVKNTSKAEKASIKAQMKVLRNE